jgi:hypothetical protein
MQLPLPSQLLSFTCIGHYGFNISDRSSIHFYEYHKEEIDDLLVSVVVDPESGSGLAFK